MDGEAQIRADRRKAENSPWRHRELRDYDYPQIEQISQILRDRICLNLRNLRVGCPGLRPASRLLRRRALRNDRYARRACGPAPMVAPSGAIVQNKANFRVPRMGPNVCTKNKL